jgi:Na+/melibiose symporter-like transporter
MPSPQQDDLRELAWIFYGIVAAVVLIVSVVQLIENEHHTVGYWLVAASWLITFAALAWGFRRRREAGAGAPHLHLHGDEADYQVEGPSGDQWTVRSIGKASAPLPAESQKGLRGTASTDVN